MIFRKRLTIFLLGGWLWQPVWADVYAYTADDGTMSLSNVPTDGRYSLLIAATQPAAEAMPAKAARTSKSVPARKAGYDKVVDKVSRALGLESALLHAVISVESRYNHKAVSHRGAAGLMQLMPATAKRYGVVDSFDPAQNLNGGAKYLKDLLGLFNNDMSLALAAYNAGEAAVIRHGNRIPPYRETRNYVFHVLDFYQHYRSGF